MFNDMLVVQSAVSAFNNAALFSPMFLWVAVLMLPVFWVAYKSGNGLIENGQWTWLKNAKYRTFNFALIAQVMIFAWLVMMGGNYQVLRDGSSVLPYIMALLLFFTSASIVQKLRVINPPLPVWLAERVRNRKLFLGLCLLLIAGLAAAFSGLRDIYGLLMTFAAVLCGALVGRSCKKGISPIFMTTAIMFTVSVVVLMQPEFFRFGQMGNLTPVHKIALVLVALLVAAIIAVRNVKPKARVHQSAYVKIKWLCRFMSALAFALFLFTESVPVFLGMAFMFLLSFALSVWHQESVNEALSKKLWAGLLFAFGILTINPVVSILGCVYMDSLSKVSVKKSLKALL